MLYFNGFSQNSGSKDSTTVPEKVEYNLKSKNALEEKVTYKADDSLQIDMQNKKVYLYGNAEVHYEKIVLKAHYIEIDFAKNIMTSSGLPDSTGNINGNPVFEEGSQKFKAKNIAYNFKTKKGKIANVFTNQDQGYIHGETIKKVNDSTFFIKHGKYTTCENEDPHFYISASKLKVVNKDKIVTGPAYLVIANVPTPLAIPFGFFPNTPTKQSGILIPTYGETPDQGFFFENGGYYFAINDYMDLALRGSIYTRGSWRASSQFRYQKRYKHRGNLSLDYSDRKFSTIGSTPVKDFNIRWSHSQDSKARPNSSFSASVNAGTSSYTKNNSYNPENVLAGSLSSTIAYRKNWGRKYNFSANLRHSQNTQTGAVNLTLPDLAFSITRQQPFQNKYKIISKKWYKNFYENIGISYNANMTNQVSTGDSTLFEKETLDLFKNGIRHSIPINTKFDLVKVITVSPSMNINIKNYRETTHKYLIEDSLVTNNKKVGFATVYDYSLSTSFSTNLYGMLSFKSKRIKAIRHVVTPSVSINYRPDFSELERGFYTTYRDTSGKDIEYNRFTGIYGGAPSGEIFSIGFNLNNNVEMKVRSKKDTITGLKKVKLIESLRFSGNYNSAADSLKLSTIAINGRTTLYKKLSLNGSATLDPYILDSAKTTRINTLRYKHDGKLGRITRANLATGYSFTGKRKKGSKKPTPEELARLDNPYSNYVDFNIPWNFRFNYNINYSMPNKVKTLTQSLNFSGDVSLTKNWKISGSSGYDFKAKDLTYTTLNFHRNLHCWEMRMSWIPFGTRQSYNFTINVKSSVLQDLKLNRRREWFDNTP